ncbi:MAG: hypothetical protein V1738_00965 [Patescibacteria group bacterium]
MSILRSLGMALVAVVADVLLNNRKSAVQPELRRQPDRPQPKPMEPEPVSVQQAESVSEPQEPAPVLCDDVSEKDEMLRVGLADSVSEPSDPTSEVPAPRKKIAGRKSSPRRKKGNTDTPREQLNDGEKELFALFMVSSAYLTPDDPQLFDQANRLSGEFLAEALLSENTLRAAAFAFKIRHLETDVPFLVQACKKQIKVDVAIPSKDDDVKVCVIGALENSPYHSAVDLLLDVVRNECDDLRKISIWRLKNLPINIVGARLTVAVSKLCRVGIKEDWGYRYFKTELCQVLGPESEKYLLDGLCLRLTGSDYIRENAIEEILTFGDEGVKRLARFTEQALKK